MTGFTREGCCTTGPMDLGSHTVREGGRAGAREGGSEWLACCLWQKATMHISFPSLLSALPFQGVRRGLGRLPPLLQGPRERPHDPPPGILISGAESE